MFDRRRRAGNGPPGRLGVLAAAAVVALGVSLLPAGAAAGAIAKPDIDAGVYAELAANGSTGFLVYLNGQADLSPASKLTDSDSRAGFVYKELVAYAERSQLNVRGTLDAHRARYKPFWIANAIYVHGDLPLLNAISEHGEVRKITPSKLYPLIDPPATAESGTDAGIEAVEWNLTNIEAPRVWSEFGVRGEGIVVANIDTGVQYNHPALVGKYRGNTGGGQFDHNYSWFDPANICGSPSVTPCDNNGHGTHTMGTMVGDDGGTNQVGVAPGAKWIAAKGCESNTCSDTSLLASAQFVLAPTDLNGQNPRPDLHADIVNNSWGGDPNDLWYAQSVDAWIAAGIFPQFSGGNDGPACGTAGSPGDYPQSYSAGAYDINNVIAGFSSRGPGVGGGIKPNLAAPGVAVRSSLPTNTYGLGNGTSMASPHVAATVALMWSAAPGLRSNINGTKALLDQTATDVDNTSCGGTAADNNVFGEGRLNAYQAVLNSPRGASGRVNGTVTDAATNAPLSGALVTSGLISATTGADGRYSLLLAAGEQTITASKYAYASQTVTVTVPEGGVVTQDFALVSVPLVTVSGRVTDGSGKAFPLYAKIEIAGRPGGPVYTNPATGRYSIQIASRATYRFTTSVVYPGYQTVTQDVTIGTGNLTHNIAVPANLVACTAPGYGPSSVLSERFDGTTTPAGWSVVERRRPNGWAFNNPGNRSNLTGGTGNFAIIDSDALGSGNSQDADLIAPPLDFSGATEPHLRFNSDYRALTSSIADIDVSTDGGTTWVNIWRQTTTDRRGPRVEEVPLTGLAGDADAMVRFRYRGTFAWWWELDNVEFSASPTSTPIIRETFDSTSTPAGWTLVERISLPPPGSWVFDDPGNRGNLTGGAGNFAIVDSDDLGSGKTQDTDLISPPIDLSTAANPHVRFNSDYRAFSNSTADVDFSLDGGTTWTNVWRQTTTDRRGPRREEVALTGAAGQANVLVRFRYRGSNAWWWEVDNVEVIRAPDAACVPLVGGLVVGFTTDRNTGLGINGVTVTSNANPTQRAVSAATPDDPNIGDGFYWLFSTATGTQSFTASKPPYTDQTKSVGVVDNNTRQLNFSLAAPRLTVTPTSLEGFVPYGESRSTTLTITNTGTAPAQVEITERGGDFQILNRTGAPLIEQRVSGLSKAQYGPAGAEASPTRAGTSVDPAWTRIANYPISVFDNTAATAEDGTVYSVGGSGAAANRKVFKFDPAAGTWSTLPDLPTSRQKPAAAWVGDKLYVIGGWDGNGVPRATVDVFDPGANTWTTLPATNPRPRATMGYGVANDKIYLVGGCTNGACAESADLVIFDSATGTFSTGTSYPQLSIWMACGGINDKIYCAGGATQATDHKNGFVYEPASDTWSPIADAPVDMWASQYSAASGLLVLAGGVAEGSTVITNRTIAYDPAADTWMDLPNAQFPRFRGAGACGVFKLGGSPTSFVGSVESENLGGLDQCATGGTDVPWLAETPDTFTLGAGRSRTVRVTMTATAENGILQPGEYTAQLAIKNVTPYPIPRVDVTMNVLPPPTWGKIQGTVVGQPCTGEPEPIQAFVRISLANNPEIGASIRADAQGRYAWWLPAGNYQVIAAKDDWNPQAKMTNLDAGFVNTVNFTLTPFAGCSSGGTQQAV